MVDRAKRNKKRPLGRPVSRLVKLAIIPTHCPESLHKYLKTVYPYRFSTLTALYESMLTQFISQKVWLHGVNWRKPRTARSNAGSENESRTGWKLVSVHVPEELKEHVQNLATVEGVSMATIVYTAMYWWAMYIMPASVVAGPAPSQSAPALKANESDGASKEKR